MPPTNEGMFAWLESAIISSDMTYELITALWDTMYMVLFSTVFSLALGFLLTLLMILWGPHGLKPMRGAYAVLDFIVNLGRSLPFIILLILCMKVTRFIVGTTIGTTASIVPLTIAATPFAARLLEGSLLEVDKSVIEAARSFGANSLQIIFRVMLPEALPSIILNVAVLTIVLIGYSAMAGVVGGGGLGDFAFRYGYQRFQTDVMWYSVIILIIVVQIIQAIGNSLYKKLR